MFKKLFAILLWMFGLNAMAQVSLEDCQKWARENYPEVKKYDIIAATEACNLSNATKNWLPAVSLYAQGGWMNNTANLGDLASNLEEGYREIIDKVLERMGITPMPHWQYRAGVEVVQPIYDGGATALQRKVASRQADVERAKIAVSLRTVEEKVLDVYFALLLLEERKEQLALRSDLLEKNMQKLRNLEKESIAREIDVQAVEVEQIKLQQLSDQLEENIRIYRMTMGLLTGHDLTTQELIRPTMPTSNSTAFSETAEMQLLDRESELLNLKNRYEKVKLMPKIGFMGQAYWGFPGTNVFRDIVKHDARINVGFGIKMSWDITPLYKRNNNLNIIRQEQATIDNYRELLVFRQRITNTALEERIKRLDKIRSQDDQIVEIRQKLRVAEEVKVDNDIVDATELLAKIDDEADAKLQRSIHETEIMHDAYKLLLFGDTEK